MKQHGNVTYVNFFQDAPLNKLSIIIVGCSRLPIRYWALLWNIPDSELGYSGFNQWKMTGQNNCVDTNKIAVIKYEEKASNLKRPPGHPVINVSECWMVSPGSLLQNWVYQPVAKFSCCGSLTWDCPQMNNKSSWYDSESSHNEALLHAVFSLTAPTCHKHCAVECGAVNGMWWIGIRAESKIFIFWGVANWPIYWCIWMQSGCCLKIREVISWIEDGRL